jgi:hypothetical protein
MPERPTEPPVRRLRPAAPRPAPKQVRPPEVVDSAGPVVSTLAEQNQLFATAMDARRRGDMAEARRLLDELLARFPFGALADSARRESAKLPRASSDQHTP